MLPAWTPVSLGVDVGGTYVRFGFLEATGGFSGYRRARMDNCVSRDDLLRLILGNVEQLRNEQQAAGVSHIGLAVPGILDERRTLVRRCINLPWCEGWHLAEAVANAAGLPAFLFTDAEAATWGEHSVHCPSSERFVHLRLGTGVACGVVLSGDLLRLDSGRTRHLDFLAVDASDGARPCRCGRDGCLDTVASGPALERAAREAGFSSLVALNGAIVDGDRAAASLVENAARMVVVVIQQITACFEPEVIALGGGVFEHVPALAQRVLAEWERSGTRGGRSGPRLVPAALGDRAGVMGAALLTMRFAE